MATPATLEILSSQAAYAARHAPGLQPPNGLARLAKEGL